MIEDRYYNHTKSELLDTDFWTNRLYECAYDRVKNRKYPLIIPSYNRPNNLMIKYIYNNTDANEPWDIYFLVRESQQEQYENNEYFKKLDYVKTLPFKDEEINDIGKVREKAVEYFKNKAECIIMMDDDVQGLSYTVPFMRPSGGKISLYVSEKACNKKINFSRIIEMWQVAMEEAIKINDRLIISCPMISGFSWAEDYCDSIKALKFMSGAQVCCICINVDNCIKYDVNFRTAVNNGHEDKDFVIRAVLAGCATAEFRWLAYQCASMGTDLRNVAVKERMSQQHDEMYNNFKDVDFVKYIIDRNDFKNVRINWNKATKYYNSLTGDNINKDNNAYDITKCFDF